MAVVVGLGNGEVGVGDRDFLSQESLIGSCLVIEAPTQSVGLALAWMLAAGRQRISAFLGDDMGEDPNRPM